MENSLWQTGENTEDGGEQGHHCASCNPSGVGESGNDYRFRFLNSHNGIGTKEVHVSFGRLHKWSGYRPKFVEEQVFS